MSRRPAAGHNSQGIPEATIARLPLYLRVLYACAFSAMVAGVGLLIAPSMEHRIVEHGRSTDRIITQTNLFAGLALLLATMGIYSVLSYAVRRRVREIGIRMALGAKRSQVLSSILGRAILLSAAGILIGGVITLAASSHRWLAGQSPPP